MFANREQSREMERGRLSLETFSDFLDRDIPEARFILGLVSIRRANTSPFVQSGSQLSVIYNKMSLEEYREVGK